MKQLLIIRVPEEGGEKLGQILKDELSDEYRVFVVIDGSQNSIEFEYPKNYCCISNEPLRTKVSDIKNLKSKYLGLTDVANH